MSMNLDLIPRRNGFLPLPCLPDPGILIAAASPTGGEDRAEKLERLQREIQNGTYRIDSRRIAEVIVRRHIRP